MNNTNRTTLSPTYLALNLAAWSALAPLMREEGLKADLRTYVQELMRGLAVAQSDEDVAIIAAKVRQLIVLISEERIQFRENHPWDIRTTLFAPVNETGGERWRTLVEALGRNEDRLLSLERELKSISTYVVTAEARSAELSTELHALSWALHAGIVTADSSAHRYIPARLFVGDPMPKPYRIEILQAAVRRATQDLELELVDELAPVEGSWWKRLVFRTQKAMTREEVRTRALTFERGLKANYIDKAEAEATKSHAEAAAIVLSALAEIPTACMQLGQLLIVKANNQVFSRVLTYGELQRIEENQHILKRPLEIMQWLDGTGESARSDHAQLASRADGPEVPSLTAAPPKE